MDMLLPHISKRAQGKRLAYAQFKSNQMEKFFQKPIYILGENQKQCSNAHCSQLSVVQNFLWSLICGSFQNLETILFNIKYVSSIQFTSYKPIKSGRVKKNCVFIINNLKPNIFFQAFTWTRNSQVKCFSLKTIKKIQESLYFC